MTRTTERTRRAWPTAAFCGALIAAAAGVAQADPCGMVPPVPIDPANPALTRIDVQQTYVFFKDGIEDIVLRPAFEGRVHEFGMLIPFPDVPAIRKKMTLTVIRGDFPRDVLAKQNLTLAAHEVDGGVEGKHGRAPAKADGVEHARAPASGARRLAFGGLSLLALGLMAAWAGRRRKRLLLAAAIGALALAVAPAVAFADDDAAALVEKLSTEERAAAVEKLIAMGEPAVPHLIGEAFEGKELVRRGWAIVCLARIGGAQAEKRLADLSTDEKQSALVRTWALAARVERAKSADQLLELAQLAGQLPAAARPIAMRLVALSKDGAAGVEAMLALSAQQPKLAQALAGPILESGHARLVPVLLNGKDDNVRRQAAGFLATLAQKDPEGDLQNALAAAYRFDPEAKDVPWAGGALFVPGIPWRKEPARDVARNLIAWHLYCERHGKAAEQKQIHNNIRSIQLARAAGYQTPGWQEVGTDQWLTIWGQAAGKAELKEMLEIQGVDGDPRYVKLLEGLK